jgi:hypothetical protein
MRIKAREREALLVASIRQIDEASMKRAMAARAATRIEQNYPRSQDLAAYGRNPIGRHGVPPH